MKTKCYNHFILSTLLGALAFGLSAPLLAQSLQTLYSFSATTPSSPWLNADGAFPTAPLLLVSNVLYGTTAVGGTYGFGTLFAIRPDGTGFTNLHTFNYPDDLEKVYPKAGLLFVNNRLYGTDAYGGLGAGSVYSITPQGTDFTTLHSFPPMTYGHEPYTNTDGVAPSGALVLCGDSFYGAAKFGGFGSVGTLWGINTNGSNFRVIYQCTGRGGISGPQCALVADPSGQKLYGTSLSGGEGSDGTARNGTVFAINTDGSGLAILHSFSYLDGNGITPECGLVLSPSGRTLYGTTSSGGSAFVGTVFAVNIDGSGFITLHHFSALNPPLTNTTAGPHLNGDGAYPNVALTLSKDGLTLFGTTGLGGMAGYGTIFSLATDGTAFTTLYPVGLMVFDQGGVQANKLLLLGDALYGTASGGGDTGNGTVFRISLLPLSSTVSAAPRRVKAGDTVTVAVSAHNSYTERITGVQVDGLVTLTGAGKVVAVGNQGPTIVPTLSPGQTAWFTNLYQATDYGKVSFTVKVKAVGPDGLVRSDAVTSGMVLIVPNGDLLVKRDIDSSYAGAGVFQTVPIPPQIMTNTVALGEVSVFQVKVQNNDSKSQLFTLGAVPRTLTGWKLQYLLGGQDVTTQLAVPGGSSLPEIQSGNALMLTVRMTPTAVPVGSLNTVTFTLGLASDPTLTLDAVQTVAFLTTVPVNLTMSRVETSGFTPASIAAGLSDINAPLALVTDLDVLSQQPEIYGGLVADAVTPLLIKIQADTNALAAFPSGRLFRVGVTVTAGGNLAEPQPGDKIKLLYPKTHIWSGTPVVQLSVAHPTTYLWIAPVASDAVHLDAGQTQLIVTVQVTDDQAGADAANAGSLTFALRKPPILLLHGYATVGNWGWGFRSVLATTRPMPSEVDPDNFVRTVRYGIGRVPEYRMLNYVSPVLSNTVSSIADCAVLAFEQLHVSAEPLYLNWAFTRYDVVAHSQGGLLARMLSSQHGNATINAPFRNPENFNRGRFHRVVTIGSPHNGSLILYYLLSLKANSTNSAANLDIFSASAPLGQLVATVGLYSQIAQAKFDPFGDQIKELNNPSQDSPWFPDPGAQFHLVRAVINGGRSPGSSTQDVSAYSLLNLNWRVRGILGGEVVLPRGSDGIVDYDSMAANGYPAALAPNVYDIPPQTSVSHCSMPNWVFGTVDAEVDSGVVARHVINALDQNGEAGENIRFAPFSMAPLLNNSVKYAIDRFASNLLYVPPMTITDHIVRDTHHSGPVAGDNGPVPQILTYSLNFPADHLPQGNVIWLALVYGPNGMNTDGISWEVDGTNSSLITLTVDPGLVGDVVLSGLYQDTSERMIIASAQVIVSQFPTGTTMTGIGVLPYQPVVAVGTELPVQLVALYSDGSSSLRFVPSKGLSVVSSDPSVVSVSDPLQWRVLAPGSAQVVVNWSGFSVTNLVTAFGSASASPELSVTRLGGRFALRWPLSASSFTLQSCSSLTPNAAWQPVVTLPQTNDQNLNLTLPFTSGSQFFRLQR